MKFITILSLCAVLVLASPIDNSPRGPGGDKKTTSSASPTPKIGGPRTPQSSPNVSHGLGHPANSQPTPSGTPGPGRDRHRPFPHTLGFGGPRPTGTPRFGGPDNNTRPAPTRTPGAGGPGNFGPTPTGTPYGGRPDRPWVTKTEIQDDRHRPTGTGGWFHGPKPKHTPGHAGPGSAKPTPSTTAKGSDRNQRWPTWWF